MTAVETLRQAEGMLGRLSAGEQPDPRTLERAPLVHAWATIPGEDVYRLGAVVGLPPELRKRPRIVPVLALDRDHKWALVIVDWQLRWWALGEPLQTGLPPADAADVIRVGAAWVRRWLQNAETGR